MALCTTSVLVADLKQEHYIIVEFMNEYIINICAKHLSDGGVVYHFGPGRRFKARTLSPNEKVNAFIFYRLNMTRIYSFSNSSIISTI